jgi:hypothetical protein
MLAATQRCCARLLLHYPTSMGGSLRLILPSRVVFADPRRGMEGIAPVLRRIRHLSLLGFGLTPKIASDIAPYRSGSSTGLSTCRAAHLALSRSVHPVSKGDGNGFNTSRSVTFAGGLLLKFRRVQQANPFGTEHAAGGSGLLHPLARHVRRPAWTAKLSRRELSVLSPNSP